MPTDDSSRTVDALISLLRDMVEQIRVVRNHAGLGVYRSLYLHCSPQMTHLDPIYQPKASQLIELTCILPAVAVALGSRCPREVGDLQAALEGKDDIRLDDLIVEAYDALVRPTSHQEMTGHRAPVAQSKSRSVQLFGRDEAPRVKNRDKNVLTNPQYDVVLALLQAGDKGLTKDELDANSNHGDSRKILKRLANSDDDWNAVISFPGTTGKGYRII